jgi:hypothetical protein
MARGALPTGGLDTDRLEGRARPALGLEDNHSSLLAQKSFQYLLPLKRVPPPIVGPLRHAMPFKEL